MTSALFVSGCFMQEAVEESNAGLESDNELSGSVGDGPVVGATMRVLRNDGELLAELESDFAASYNVTVKTKGKYYPLTIDAQDGTDMVTFLAPDFRMSSAVLEPSKKTVANINPFTTVALELASEMSGGRSSSNIKDALNIVVTQLNSGLDTLVSTNPMSKRIDASNIAEIVKASETLGETIRRTRDALLAVGRTATGDAVVQSLGSDLTDSVVDGVGGTRTDARIAAVSTIAAAQTALESMRNQLHVNGSNATILMTDAIGYVLASEPRVTLAELVVTEGIIQQARIGVIAAEQVSPSSEIAGLRQAISSVQPGMLPSVVNSMLPRDASRLLDNVLLTVAAGDDSLLDTVNDTARNGGAVPPANRAPVIQGSPAANVAVGASYDFVPVADDPDSDPLTFTVTGKPLWANFDTLTGGLSGTPGAGDVGLSPNIVIGVSDGQLTANLAPFSITVEELATNSPPTISGSAQAVITVGNPYDFTPTASDADGDTLTFSINNKPAWAGFSTSSGHLSGTPGAGDEGTYSNIVITVTDGTDGSSLAPFSITVNVAPVNQPPTISGTPASTAAEGSAYVFVPTASDPEGVVLTFTITGKPDWTSFDSTSGSLSGTPAATDVGIHGNILISVSDGMQTVGLAPFSITVMAANSSPLISGSPDATVIAGTAYEFTPSSSDPDGDSLTFSVIGLPTWASFDPTSGRLSGTPGAEHVGIHGGIVITVSDGEDDASLGPFAITVDSIGMGSATLSWTGPSENEDGSPLIDLAGYKLYWGTTPGIYPNSVTINNPGITTYVIENLAPGTYEFVSTAFNSAGVESANSNTATKIVP